MRAPDHPQEKQRVATLRALEILDTETGEAWDRIAETASILCETPIALISLVDQDRQWFKARIGLEAQETPRELAFCGHAILQDDVFVVPDATADERFANNALVTGDPDIRSYAGAPIYAPDGMPIGTVCAIDRIPRQLERHQLDGLRSLARLASSLLKTRQAAFSLERTFSEDTTIQGARGIINEVADQLMNPLTPIVIQLKKLKNAGADPETIATIERHVARIKDVAQSSLRNIEETLR